LTWDLSLPTVDPLALSTQECIAARHSFPAWLIALLRRPVKHGEDATFLSKLELNQWVWPLERYIQGYGISAVDLARILVHHLELTREQVKELYQAIINKMYATVPQPKTETLRKSPVLGWTVQRPLLLTLLKYGRYAQAAEVWVQLRVAGIPSQLALWN